MFVGLFLLNIQVTLINQRYSDLLAFERLAPREHKVFKRHYFMDTFKRLVKLQHAFPKVICRVIWQASLSMTSPKTVRNCFVIESLVNFFTKRWR